MTALPRVLVIDDNLAAEATETNYFYDRNAFLEDNGEAGVDFLFCSAWDEIGNRYSVEAATAYVEGLESKPAVVLLDMRFGSHPLLGQEILTALSQRFPAIPVIVMTSTAKEELWAQCMALGAVDYLVKPIRPEILRQTLTRYSDTNPQFWLVGQSENFIAAVDQVARASEGGTSSVLLTGASGTGKELFARYLHRHGRRRTGPFQAVHIPGIPEHMMEAELFGYSKGSFTGAIREERGRLLRANSGILFLDEVGDLGPAAQAALLRVLETREVTRLGDSLVSRIDVQVVAATNSNLVQRVKENSFRIDLYTRLAATVVHLPALASRKMDLALLLRQLLRRAFLERELVATFSNIPGRAVDAAARSSWPGNVRELWNYVQRVVDHARGTAPRLEDFLACLSLSTPPIEEDQPAPGSAERSALEILPPEIVRNSSDFLGGLALRELSLLWSALEMTRDPVSGVPNRAKAAALLKGRTRCSTNDFDRWLQRVLMRLATKDAEQIIRQYPDLQPERTTGHNHKREAQ